MNFGRNFAKFGDFGHVRNFLTNEIQNPGCNQGSRYRPVRPNRRGPVPVYRTGLAGNRSKPVEVKFKFKILYANGSYRYTGRFDW
jgi:hypothetical protein